jgi:hypothetical protein
VSSSIICGFVLGRFEMFLKRFYHKEFIFTHGFVPMGVKHNEIDESECIRSGFKNK